MLCRCDFNVPQDKQTGAITDDKRIRAALPTLQYLLDQGAAVIACSHLGKPKGEVKPALTLAPVAHRLEELLGREVIFASDVVGPDAQAKAAALQPGQLMLLENLRFEKGEEKNDPAFAKALADLAGPDGVYVSDAFGTVHRAHASTAGVAEYLPAVSGFLIQKELEIIGGALANPKRPLVAILGGSKVSSKIGVINNLLEIADTIIIGGGMATTFAAAQGGKVGTSPAGGRLDGLRQRDGEEGRRQGASSCCCRWTPWWPTPLPPTPTARWYPAVRFPTAGWAWTSAPRPSSSTPRPWPMPAP